MTAEFRHVPCVACGCLSDDVTLRVETGRIVAAEGACDRGTAYFLAQNAAPGEPAALIAGQEAPLDDAVREAARLLAASRYPLVYGFTQTTAEAQRAAVRLADLIGANIDTTAGPAHGAEALALQAVGKVTCTLGEVKNRADLIIYWGCSPADYPHQLGTGAAEIVLPGGQFELLQVLRALVNGRRVNPSANMDLEAARNLAQRMKQARFGVVFYGPGDWANVAALHALAADLHQFTRFYALSMGGDGNAAGAETVLASETAFPFAVNLSQGYPRYGPGEFTARELLAKREVDLVLAVTSDPVADFGGRLPEAIVINPGLNRTSQQARVHLTTAPYGVSAEGTVSRVDGISLPLRPSLPSPYPTDEAMLSRLCAAIEELTYA